MGEKAVQTLHTRCGKRIRVRQENGTFRMTESCPEGHMDTASELLSKCGTCCFADTKIAIVRATDVANPAPVARQPPVEQTVPAAPPAPAAIPAPPAPPPAPKLEKTAVPAQSTAPIPVPPTAPPPARVPAPAPAPAAPPAPVLAPAAPVHVPSGIPYDQQVEEEQRVQPTASPACPTCGQPMLCTPAGWSCLTPHEQPALDKDAGELSFSLDSPTALPAPPALQLPVAPQPIMSADAVMAQQAQTQVLAPAASPAAILIDKAELSAQERAANALPLLEDLVLPGGITLGTPPATEDAVDVDAVLAMIDGYVVGPSSGGFSSHILADTVCARRTYLKYVLGLEPIAMPSYFKFGTLMHAVLAMRYMHGESRQWEPCDRVAQAGAPSMAAAVKRLLTVQFTKYQKEEYETWCPRAIEHNLIAWLPVKVGKKTVAVPLTCRVDMILGLKKPSEVHPGPGPLPQGIYLLDWKTTSGITYDLVEGYGSDFQFLLQSAIFELGGHARDFGPLRGILVSIAEKQRKGAKKEPDFDSFQRIEAPISKSRLAEFINYELTPMVTDFYNRLDSDELRAAGHLGWPKDIRHCISRWGRCSFYDYCERGNTAIYKMEPSRLIVLSELAKPPVGWKPEAAAEEVAAVTAAPSAAPVQPAAPATEPKAKADPLESPALACFAEALLAGCATEPYASAFSKDKFFVPDHTPEKVQKQLTETLKVFYAESVKAQQKFQIGPVSFSFQKSGLAWTSLDGKGKFTWKGIAEWICKKNWFDPKTALAE